VGGYNKYNKVFDVYFLIFKTLLRRIAELCNDNAENQKVNEQNIRFIVSTYFK